MVEARSVLAKRSADGCPLKRFMPLMPVGLPLDYAHPESSCRHALPPSGLRPAFGSGAALQSDRSRLKYESSHGQGAISLQGEI